MGKKATNFLIHGLLLIATILLALIGILSANAGHFAPSAHIIIAFIGLAQPIFLLVNVVGCIYWIYKKYPWISLIPIFSIVLNFNYFSKIYRLSPILTMEQKIIKSSPSNLKILSYNLHHFGEKNFEAKRKTICSFLNLHNIDIACFQEYNISKNNKKQDDQLFDTYHYRILNIGSDLTIYSRFPIISSDIKAFPSSNGSYLICNIALCHSFDLDTIAKVKKINLITTHLQSTGISTCLEYSKNLENFSQSLNRFELTELLIQQMSANFTLRENQINHILSDIQSLNGPVIFCGDLNDTPQSYVYTKTNTLLKDTFTNAGFSYIYTYKYFRFLRIDYIFRSNEFTTRKFYTINMPWSDHNPVIAELEIQD